MKKLLILSLLIASQFTFAAVTTAKPVVRMTTEQARKAVEGSYVFKKIRELKDKMNSLSSDPALKAQVTKVIDMSLRDAENNRDAISLSASERGNLLTLLEISPIEIMTEIARLASIAKDASSTPQEKEMAAKSLQLMAKGTHGIELPIMISTNDAKTNAENAKKMEALQSKVAGIISLSLKISGLDFGVASKTFVEKYEKALIEGKTSEEAVKIASNGKFTEKELRECE